MEQSVTLLKKHGLKATPQRIAIYDYLLHTETHPTVDTIYASLHPTHPTMSLATVYKTVAVSYTHLDVYKRQASESDLGV